jgi:hypothetical protein
MNFIAKPIFFIFFKGIEKAGTVPGIPGTGRNRNAGGMKEKLGDRQPGEPKESPV